MRWRKLRDTKRLVPKSTVDELKNLLRKHGTQGIRTWPELLDNKHVSGVLKCYLAELPHDPTGTREWERKNAKDLAHDTFFRAHRFLSALLGIRRGIYNSLMRRAVTDYDLTPDPLPRSPDGNDEFSIAFHESIIADPEPEYVKMSRAAITENRLVCKGSASKPSSATRGLIIKTISDYVPDTRKYRYEEHNPELDPHEADIKWKNTTIRGLAKLVKPRMSFTNHQIASFLKSYKNN